MAVSLVENAKGLFIYLFFYMYFFFWRVRRKL